MSRTKALTAATLLGHNAVAILPGLCAHLSRRTGLELRIEARDGDRSSDAPTAWRHDLLWACGLLSLRAVVAADRAQVGEIVAAPVFAGERAPCYRSLVVARRDGPVRTLADVAGGRVAINEGASWSGCHALLAHLARSDLSADFAAVLTSGSHRRSLEAVADGRADAAAIDHTVWAHLAREEPTLTRTLRIVDRTADRPAPPFLLGRDIDPPERAALLDALLGLAPGDVEGISHVQACTAEAYRPLLDAAERQAAIVSAWSD